nr:hypothetical protein [Tanacetum cinerariifolium]
MTFSYLPVVILARFLLSWMLWRSLSKCLVPSIPKSTAYLCNVPNAIKASILNSMPFAEGVLPVRYLGVPLISSRLLYPDCKILVEKLESRVNDWRNKFLSLAGRLQLIRWPLDWLTRFPFLDQLHVPLLLDDMDDAIIWRDMDGVLRPFSVACAWDTIRSRADVVSWNNVVWFSHCIPRHVIHMWLVIQQKLKTQDRLRQWDVWSKLRVLCTMDAIAPSLMDVVSFIIPISQGKTVVNVLSRIVVAATCYYIWLERNERLFKKKSSSPDHIVDVILSMVRLKLVTFKFKKMSTKSRLQLG